MGGSIIDAEKLQNKQFIKKQRSFVCSDNLNCGAEIKIKMSDKDFNDRFYFSRGLLCPMCGQQMYYYGDV